MSDEQWKFFGYTGYTAIVNEMGPVLYSGIILCIGLANERWRYIVTPSLIGWAHTHTDPYVLTCPAELVVVSQH